MATYRIEEEQLPVRYDPPKLMKGADWLGFSVQIMQDDGINPQDTTDYTCEIIVQSGQNGETYATLSIGSGITHTAANGLFAVYLDDSVVAGYDWKTADYKMIVTTDAGKKIPYFYGKLGFI